LSEISSVALFCGRIDNVLVDPRGRRVNIFQPKRNTWYLLRSRVVSTVANTVHVGSGTVVVLGLLGDQGDASLLAGM